MSKPGRGLSERSIRSMRIDDAWRGGVFDPDFDTFDADDAASDVEDSVRFAFRATHGARCPCADCLAITMANVATARGITLVELLRAVSTLLPKADR